jgi:hypothetical protein
LGAVCSFVLFLFLTTARTKKEHDWAAGQACCALLLANAAVLSAGRVGASRKHLGGIFPENV